MAAKKVKEQKKFSFVQVQIVIFTLLGFALGAFISVISMLGLFDNYMASTLKYIEDDWSRTEYFANRLADQTIAFRKMLSEDRVKKVDYAAFDKAVDLRARMIGGDTLEDKVPLLKGFEEEINKVIEFYNGRVDLRKKRFSYIEWGNATKEYIKEYEHTIPAYNEAADDFNGKLKLWPYNWNAKKKMYKVLPLTEEGKITPVQTATEKYFKPLPGPPREVEGYVDGEKNTLTDQEKGVGKSGGHGGGKKE